MPWPPLPTRCAIGTTLETNRTISPVFSSAPSPRDRSRIFARIPSYVRVEKRFITIEPIMACDPNVLAEWVLSCLPDWVNIGADSKGHHLPEPSAADLCALVHILRSYGQEVRVKSNLRRLRPEITEAEWQRWVGGVP